MAVFHQYQQLPAFTKPVVTIGSFDGVHLGHKVILNEVVSAAKQIHGESILITFYPHPRKIIHPDIPIGLLSSLDQKIQWIENIGVNHIVVVPFTRDFSMLSATEYIEQFLLNNFHPEKIVIGYDHRFGHSREGDIDLLKHLIPKEISVQEISAKLIDDAAISSTKIRKAIVAGDVTFAASMLGRYYSYTATVVHGNKLGRTIGFPTANLQQENEDILLPGLGVYAVMVKYNNRFYKGMMSIGYRPTVTNDNTITAEVNILNFNEDIYGKHLQVFFIKHLRSEEKFDSLDTMVKALYQDELNTREVLAEVDNAMLC